MLFFLRPEALGSNHIRHEAAGFYIGQQDNLIGADDGGSLRHEVDSAEHDYIGTGFGSVLAQLQGVADKIGYILNLAQLIVMDKDNGIPFLLESRDLLYQRRILIFHSWLSSRRECTHSSVCTSR